MTRETISLARNDGCARCWRKLSFVFCFASSTSFSGNEGSRDNFSHQIHDLIVELRQRRSGNYRVVGIRARRETRTDARDLVCNLSAAP